MLFFLTFILMQFIFTTVSQTNFFDHECNNVNYTNNSVFKKNLDNALSSIFSDTTHIDHGFYNFSSGEEPDRANVIAYCRGPVSSEKCRACVNASTISISQVCPYQKEAVGWANDCQLRYSNNSIYGVRSSNVMRAYMNVQKARDADGFNQALRTLLDRLRNEAAVGSSISKSATGDIEAPDFNTIYGLVDCSPDLSSLDCNGCLSQILNYIPSCCNASISARIVTTSCQLNFEIHPLYESLPSPPPPSTQGIAIKTIIIIVVSTVSAAVLMTTIYIILRTRKRMQDKSLEIVEDEISSVEMLQFDLNTIKLATNEFSSENKLGQGGFGAVYMGKLDNGKIIAVKRLAKDSQQGDVEFTNEVILMANLRHINLVSLVGFCLEKNERLLIYEFVPNGSLHQILFDSSKRVLLDWIRRYKIIVGIARGLLYLHEDSQLRIIHRDLKASNILLDAEMTPKIADFGMARLFELDETRAETSRIVGTYGYMAPEYAMQGRFSTKSDVFSFGILILEILTGQKVNHFHDGENIPTNLLSFAWNKWRKGNGLDIIDSTLGSESRNEMMKMIHIGLLCVQENVEARPTIASVIAMLNSISLILPLPSKPAFLMNTTTTDADGFNSYSSSSPGYEIMSTRSDHSASKPHSQYSDNEASVTELLLKGKTKQIASLNPRSDTKIKHKIHKFLVILKQRITHHKT